MSKQHSNADKILVGKVICALLLLEGLAKQNLPFVFKGGTALMLHFNSTKRLSIDIDIILPSETKNLETILESIIQEQGFLRKELQHRSTTSKIKKEHYKFFYTPSHKTNKTEEYVLLDILFEEVNYTNLVSLPIQSDFVPIIDQPLNVNVPSLEDILGDKLTAFAPNTTGIPYFKKDDSMNMEIIKQLYDIGNLFDAVTDIETIKTTFYRFAKTEIAYHNSEGINENDVLQDIYETSLCIVTRGADGKGNFEELLNGILRIKGFIFSESYHIEKAITHASKAAYLSVLIQHDTKVIDKFENPLLMKDWQIGEPLNSKLNKLKKSNPEAFFYWYRIYELRK
ncbi:MAG TPA: nucleotidyl transferase AbiEii/AbiGii toxin family protein [Chitinophagales bacterium]|nr:nucleotidyl transferase AbiEii/AbiGii toxin family protein [Chitinophagales bacterium]HQW78911.1 nucleotidyl transferase AbiEii/AbiGii toxin family protein [Chitinophagales bacterium]HRB67051.1 nucleotidyl transferase AbiEii/AbiGii toxin family protein [Chitinophagales bacterium]